MSGFQVRINNGVLYEGLDGREAFVFVSADRVTFVTDIHGQGHPNNAVVLDREALQWIIDEMDARAEGAP